MRYVYARVPRASSCAEMLTAHDSLVTRTPGALRSVDDPVATDVEAYEKWTEALLRSGQITARGDWCKVSLRAAVPVALRVASAWFH